MSVQRQVTYTLPRADGTGAIVITPLLHTAQRDGDWWTLELVTTDGGALGPVGGDGVQITPRQVRELADQLERDGIA